MQYGQDGQYVQLKSPSANKNSAIRGVFAIIKSMNNQYLGYKTLVLFVLARFGSLFVFGFIVIGLVVPVLGNLTPPQVLSQFPNLPNALLGIGNLLVLFGVFLGLLAILIGFLEYTHYTFSLGDNSLSVQRGILNTVEVAIPYRQIQSVDIDRNLFDQIVGVSRLVILSAGQADKSDEEESREILPALDADRAESLQKEILRRADIEKVSEVKPQ